MNFNPDSPEYWFDRIRSSGPWRDGYDAYFRGCANNPPEGLSLASAWSWRQGYNEARYEDSE